ncbi:helix-turn-helix transcriptional regulator [Piscicoccus intestinalis]|uniref:helix-turn-helix transcriptional regulator n=1 Tax=Piscicoccus intestinalis TaxID=746033 RepID=UPI00147058E6|nr:helix-turn-helix transcriptional regulator [Piscicoccus intestinalis]
MRRPFQPARDILKQKRWTVAAAAREIGVSQTHLGNTVTGRNRPNDIVREKLPELLGVPLEELFYPDMIVIPFSPRPSQHSRRKKVADDE